jgi:Tfp pilus assembly protein PilN
MITFLSKIIKLNTINVVGVIKKENDEAYNLLAVKKKGNKIEIIRKDSFDTFEKLLRNIDVKIPILLLIDGKGVLNKEIDLNNEADLNWQKNIDFSTIYYTELKGLRSNFISFCRKNSINETLNKFKEKGFQTADIYVGSFLSALLQNTINNEIIVSNNLVLEFENEKLYKFSKQIDPIKQKDYTIVKEVISSKFLPLYGVLIHFFIQQKEVSKTNDKSLNVEEIIYKKAFNTLGVSLLLFFMSTLFVSYFLIQFYNSKNTALNLQNTYSNKSYQLILNLEKQKENKKQILKESGFLSSKFLSYYSYEIIKEIPKDISLVQLNVIPLNAETKANKKISFETKSIIIKGETFNESSFNNWMENLKKVSWLKNFEIISLKKDKKNKSQFEVKITIKDV